MIATPLREKSLVLQQQYGEVTQVAGEALSVRTGETVLRARRAASCLLTPLMGDKVLLVTDHDDAYVLAVLERSQANQATLELPGDTEIRAGGGRLRLTARDGIGMETASDVSLLATQLNVSAVQSEVLVQGLLIARVQRHGAQRFRSVRLDHRFGRGGRDIAERDVVIPRFRQ